MVSSLARSTAFFDLLTWSHLSITREVLGDGHGLVPQTAAALYADAPFCVLAHDTSADPVFIYANKAAQACFGYSWDEFVTLPSRLSAEAPDREERRRLLDAVAAHGYVSDYRGQRIAKSGERFWIEGAVVWNLLDRTGFKHGQAALFDPPRRL